MYRASNRAVTSSTIIKYPFSTLTPNFEINFFLYYYPDKLYDLKVHSFNCNSFARSAYMHSLGILELICSGRIQIEVWRLEETEERGRLNARNRTLPLASIRLEGRQRSGLQGAAPHLRLPHAALTSLLSLLPSCWTWRVRPP